MKVPITEAETPLLYHCLLTIRQDGGGINRVETPDGMPASFDIELGPRDLTPAHYEEALFDLTPEERDTLAIGECMEQQAIAGRSRVLGNLDIVLALFFGAS